MRIAMMGSGGIGGLVGARLAELGEDVHFIARGEHLAAMQSKGLRLLSPFGDVHLARTSAVEDPAEIGPVDLVFLAVKLWDVEAAGRRLHPLLGPKTRVVTLQNGIDGPALLRRHVPPDQVVRGITYASAAILEPGVILSPGGPRRIVIDRAGGDPVIAAIESAARRAIGMDLELSDDIDTTIWTKFIRFAAFAAATTVTRSRIGTILRDVHAEALLRQLVDEGVSVSAAAGATMPAGFTDETMAFFGTLAAETRASMADDLEHGKRLEVDFVSGHIHRLGLAHDIATPAHTAAYRALMLHAGGARH
jgi:2-dehydropantoate 2-reductase